MDIHEMALATHEALQKRKIEKGEQKERDINSFKIEGVIRANKRRYQDFYSKRRVY